MIKGVRLICLLIVFALNACATSTPPRPSWDDPNFRAQRMKQAAAAYGVHRYHLATLLLFPLAQHGEANAQYALGYLLFYGKGAERNRAQAMVWFQKAAAQGDVSAVRALAMLAEHSDGVKTSAVQENGIEEAEDPVANAIDEKPKASNTATSPSISPSPVIKNTEITEADTPFPDDPSMKGVEPPSEQVTDSETHVQSAEEFEQIVMTQPINSEAVEVVGPNPVVEVQPGTEDVVPSEEQHSMVANDPLLSEPILAEPVSPATAVGGANSPDPLVQSRGTTATKMRALAPSIGRQWLELKDPDYYTVQLLAGDRISQVEAFVRRHGIEDQSAIVSRLRSQDRGKWYMVLYGAYPTFGEANDAIKALPEALRRKRPWLRQIGKLLSEPK